MDGKGQRGGKNIRTIVLLMLLAFFLYRIDLFYNLLKSLIGIMMTFIIGLLMALLINQPMRYMERRFTLLWKAPILRRYRRGVCLAISVVLVIAVLSLFFVVIVPETVVVLDTLIRRIPEAFDRLDQWLANYNVSLRQLLGMSDSSESSIRDFTQRAGSFLLAGLTQSSNVVFSAAQLVINSLVGLVFAIYLLYSKERIRGQGTALITAYLPPRHGVAVQKVLGLLISTYSRFLTGQVLQAIVSASLIWVCMKLFRFPFEMFVALITFLCAFIPIFGPYIAAVLSALMIFSAVPDKTLYFLLMYLVVQQMESSFIYPRILSNAIDMPSVWVLVAVTLGGGIMGIAGMLFLIPLFAVIYRLLAEDTRRRNERAQGEAAHG